MPKRTKTITAATKHKVPRPKRKRPKTTPSPLTATPPDLGTQPAPAFEAIEIGGPIVGNAASNFGTPCHDPAPIDEALWRARVLPSTAPEPLWPMAFGGIGAENIVRAYEFARRKVRDLRRWLADRLTRLVTLIRPTD